MCMFTPDYSAKAVCLMSPWALYKHTRGAITPAPPGSAQVRKYFLPSVYKLRAASGMQRRPETSREKSWKS